MSNLRRTVGCCVLIWVLAAQPAFAENPKYIILMIGDGMGFEQVKAASFYLNGAEGTLSFEALPYQAEVTTYSASSSVTDSAAAATAMATGYKVSNGVISMAYPGDGSELETALEYHKALGLSVGLVSTTTMTHATPAGFGAHNVSRNNNTDIGSDYLNQTRPNVLLGGGLNGLTTTLAINAGYDVVTSRTGLLGLNTEDPLLTLLSGQFGTSHLPYEYDGAWGDLPHLSEMTTTALAVLDNDPDGFFMMVEGGKIDHAGHDNQLERNIFETIEFADTVQVVLDWASGRTDTLVIVTADHETGDLTVIANNGAGNWPTVTWGSTGHTSKNVPIYATGPLASYVTGVLDNTDIFTLITNPSPRISHTPDSIAPSVMVTGSLPSYVDSFTIANGGFDTMDYAITTNASWLDVDPVSGDSSGETDTIWLLYDTASLDIGTHVGTIEITSAAATNSPQTVTVTVTIEPGPADYDGDRDVDLDDYGHLQACFGTGDVTSAPECANADLNNDNAVNQADRTVFNGCISGPGVYADLNCAG